MYLKKILEKEMFDFGATSYHACPFCGKYDCYDMASSTNTKILFRCNSFTSYPLIYSITPEIENYWSGVEKDVYFNLIFEHCISHPRVTEPFFNYYLDKNSDAQENELWHQININSFRAPIRFGEITDRTLLNLARLRPNYADVIPANSFYRRAFFADSKEDVFNGPMIGIAKVMIDMGYLTNVSSQTVTITAKGWQRIDELSKTNFDNHQCFVAMSFKEETKTIREILREGLSKSGYTARFIDEKEHNNQIVPEIFYEIDHSRFLLMDVTVPNLGAYYEAGYALGKGKQVIITCREDAFHSKERPHFDIQQKSMIIWTDEDDLLYKLQRRIKATIGI